MVILQTQSTAGAALEIIVMLLGAALIGVLTTYFYMKSRYQKTINTLQSKLEEAEKSKDRLNEDLKAAQKELAEKSDQNEKLQKQYDELMKKEKVMEKAAAEGKKTSEKLQEIEAELKEAEMELKEKEELLKRISERKHLIDYARIGTASKENSENLKMISGIGPFIEEKLNSIDIYTFEQISKFRKKDMDAVTEAIEFFPGRIERDEWVAQAKELVYTGGKKSEVLENIAKRKHRINYDRIGITHKDDAQDLTAIHGIGEWIQEKLYALDIFTYKQIAKFSEEDVNSVTEVIEFFPGRIERDEWVAQAKKLAEG